LPQGFVVFCQQPSELVSEESRRMFPPRLRIMIVTSRDSGGGAPRAIHRIYRALQDNFDDRADFYLRVVHKSFDDNKIIGGKPARNRLEGLEYFLRTRFRKFFPRPPFVSENRLLHSQALYPTGLGRELNAMRPDVIMLGWLGNSTLSIREISRLRAPLVWRLSDMWVFSGAEHYASEERYRLDYRRGSRPKHESGPDINRETFLRKKRLWRRRQRIISPSRWMAQEAMASGLTRNWPCSVIPNVIDCRDWRATAKELARRSLGLPVDGSVVLFGAGSGLKDHHKGGDLFLESLRVLASKQGDLAGPVVAAIFGQDGEDRVVNGVRVTFLGKLNDRQLRLAYSSADLMVVPSRMDNFPSTAAEAQAMGLPVVGFDVSGMPDIVLPNLTGLLVEPFDTSALGEAIFQLISNPALAHSMGERARSRALDVWNPIVIAGRYFEVLFRAAGEKKLGVAC